MINVKPMDQMIPNTNNNTSQQQPTFVSTTTRLNTTTSNGGPGENNNNTTTTMESRKARPQEKCRTTLRLASPQHNVLPPLSSSFSYQTYKGKMMLSREPWRVVLTRTRCGRVVILHPPPPRSSISGKDEQMAKTDMVVSSSATLADSQCMEAAEVIRAKKEHLASVVRTAISVRCARDVMTLTACVPQVYVKRSGDIESEGYERSLEHCISVYSDKELITSEGCSNISNCSNGSSSSSHSRELIQGDNFLVISGREWLARGCQLLKRTCQGKEDYLLFLPPPPRSSISGKDEQMAKTDMAVSSSATLADSQCMEAAEVIRAEKEHLASVVRTTISVRCARDIMTLTACVPQVYVKRSGDIESEGYERSLEHCISVYSDKELITSEGRSNISNCSNGSSSSSHSRELIQGDNFFVISGREWLARGCQLLKRTCHGNEDYLLFLV
ncbi:hypothetical protein F2Q68_00045226 [Brassica cretica]|uniref:VAN3-binding protein-like auxin canalisation domain-containing protein n=1 Tax=Brassica cretica TaxID=69181 RepID=A0A8S9LK81_BRACR|nr:hypothetical protein F2Q68_00045226 [Brassica cretica]